MKSLLALAIAVAMPAFGVDSADELAQLRVAAQNTTLKAMRLQLALVESLGPERLDEIIRAFGSQEKKSEALEALADYRRLAKKAQELRSSDDPGEWLLLKRLERELEEAKKEVWKEFHLTRLKLQVSIPLAEARLEQVKGATP
jgi:hypothetical protein